MADPQHQSTIGRPYAQRIADAGPLGEEMWAAVKSARDNALGRLMQAQDEYERFDALLKAMQVAGLADHLPTIEEVCDAG